MWYMYAHRGYATHYMPSLFIHVCPSIRPMYAWRDKGHKGLMPLVIVLLVRCQY